MNAAQLGRAHRALRQRARLRQQDVADGACTSRGQVSRLENGHAGELRLAEIERCFAVLDARVDVRPQWRGAGLDRLLDEGHARATTRVIGLLRRRGWAVAVEVSYSHFGERGSIDVLGWHPTAGALLIVEVKTELGSLEGLLRPLDAKARLGPAIARERFGWRAMGTSKVVVVLDDRTARRHAERHSTLLRAVLPASSRQVRAWLRRRAGSISGLWFLSDADGGGATRNPSATRRGRRAVSARCERE